MNQVVKIVDFGAGGKGSCGHDGLDNAKEDCLLLLIGGSSIL